MSLDELTDSDLGKQVVLRVVTSKLPAYIFRYTICDMKQGEDSKKLTWKTSGGLWVKQKTPEGVSVK